MFGSRQRRLEQLRSGWGRPRARTYDRGSIERSHTDRVAVLRERAPIDARTWADLDLAAVFESIDRTESTLGQHALFHRLRTPQADALPSFEALVTRLSSDAAARERAQLALGTLQDGHGYNIWWVEHVRKIDVPPHGRCGGDHGGNAEHMFRRGVRRADVPRADGHRAL